MNNLNILECTACGANLKLNNYKLLCINNNCRQSFDIIDGIYKIISPQLEVDLQLTRDKWEEFYKKQLDEKEYDKLYQTYIEDNYDNVFKQLNESKQINDIVFLEIGCGPLLLGQAIAKKCKLIVGIDISLSALKVAKKMLECKGIINYLLILGDINKMPIKENSIDLLYGGGVIEHFKNTQSVINEMYRVLKPGGISFNTVPYLNLGSLTYRQVWGNIPNLPIIKQLAEFIHIKLLRAKHMTFGYELSFSSSHLKFLHKKIGFKKVAVDKFDTKLMFDFIPFNFLKKICIYLANHSRLFWPMVKIIAEK